jgi:hypothetical protein
MIAIRATPHEMSSADISRVDEPSNICSPTHPLPRLSIPGPASPGRLPCLRPIAPSLTVVRGRTRGDATNSRGVLSAIHSHLLMYSPCSTTRTSTSASIIRSAESAGTETTRTASVRNSMQPRHHPPHSSTSSPLLSLSRLLKPPQSLSFLSSPMRQPPPLHHPPCQ